MPSLENIEKFKSVLNQLGDEPGILEERGEHLEDVPVPEEGLPDDLSALLGDVEAELGIPEDEEEGELDQLPADFAGGDTGEAGDVTSGFGDEAILDELEDVLADTGEEGPPPEEKGPLGEQPEPDEFTIPEGLFEENEAPEEGPFEEEPPEVPDMDILGDEESETGFEEAGENEFALSEEIQEESAGEEFGEDELGLPEEIEEEAGGVEEPAEEEFGLPEELQEGLEEEPGLSEELSQELAGPSEEAGIEAGIEVDEFAIPDLDIEDVMEIDTEAGAETGGEEDFELPGEISLGEPGGEEEAGDDFELPEDLKFSEEEELDTLGEDDLGTEGFSLGNISEDFGVLEDTGDEEIVEAAPAVSGFVPESEGDEDFELSDEDFRSVQRTMGALPRNLKIAIEELIGEKGLGGKDLRKLLHLLIGGASPKELADATGKIRGKKIKIPDQYEKRTGLELEEAKGTFAYAFRHNILPILRVAGIAAVVIGLLGFVGYRFLYRPLHAQQLYKQGYGEIQKTNYTKANDYFDRGLAEWQRKDWFFRYAEAFIAEREYSRA